MAINNRPLKAYVRFDGSGRIVAGSLILRKNKPKVGKWKEIQAYECCGDIECGCEKNTLVIPLINMNDISAPYNALNVEIVCKIPEIVTFHGVQRFPEFLTLEELISYFNEAKSEQFKITLISETEIEVEYCKNIIECLYEDPPCFGYTMTIRIDNVVIADVCNV